MKDILFAILFLAIITALFSYFGDRTPYEFPPKDGWAFFGNSGKPIPQEGEDGEEAEDNVFTLTEQKETNTKETGSPFSFSVEIKKPTAEEEQTGQEKGQAVKTIIAVLNWCVAIGLAIDTVLLTILFVLWLQNRKPLKKTNRRRSHDQNGKRTGGCC